MPHSLKNRLEIAALRTVERLLCTLKWETAQKVGAFVGGFLTRVLRKRWAMTVNNVTLAFPEKSPKECSQIALEAWRSAGITGAEFAR